MVSASEQPSGNNFSRLVVLSGLVLTVLASLVIWFEYHEFAVEVRSGVLANLATVGDLKASELERWRADTLESARAFANQQPNTTLATQALSLPYQVTPGTLLSVAVEEFRAARRIREVALVDAQGAVRAQWPSTPVLEDDDAESIRLLLQAPGPVFDDLHVYASGEEPHFAAVVPLRRADGTVAGGLILRSAPNDFLQPFLTKWPSTSATAETVLVRKRGKLIESLRGARFDPHVAGGAPVLLTGQSGAMAEDVTTQRGALDGVDYDHHVVLAWSHPVKGSAWTLLTKMDVDEALLPVARRFWLSIFANLALVLFVLLHNRMWQSEARAQQALQRATTAATRAERDRRFRKIIENGWDVVMLLNNDGHASFVSASMRRVLGLDAQQMVGQLLVGYVHPDDRAGLAARLDHVRELPHLACQCEVRMRHDSGRWVWVEIAATNHLAEEDVAGIIVNLRDVTQQKAAEEHAARLRRMYVVLMGSNKAITRASSIGALLQRVCEIAVQEGQFAQVCIGRVVGDVLNANARAFQVSHCASAAGAEPGCFKDRLTGQFADDFGELATALLAGRRFVDNDLQAADLDCRFWQLAKEAHLGAGTVMPLRVRGSTFAVMAFFSDNANVFDDDEMRLLGELASDLAQAMDVDLGIRERRELEVQAELEEERMNALLRLNAMSDAASESDLVKWVVEEAERLTGSELACLHFVGDDQRTLSEGVPSDALREQLDPAAPWPKSVRQAGIWTAPVREVSPVIINDRQILEQSQRFPVGQPELHRFLGAPAVTDGRVPLLIGVANKGTDYDEKDARLLGLLVSSTWAAIVKKRQSAALADSESRYRALFEASPQPMWIYDTETLHILLANPATLDYMHLTMEDLTAKSLLDLAPLPNREKLRSYLETVNPSGLHDTTWEYLSEAGETRIGHFVARSLVYQGRPAQLVLGTDVTDQTALDEERRVHANQLHRAMVSTISVVQSLGELRDPYTHGHERRVGEIAAAIGQEMGLDANAVQGLRVAGYIHDLGKIGVPSEILAKPGRLASTEMALIRQHPAQGYEILKALDFPWPVAQVTLQHHERLDGSGYPAGLKGDEIALEARIVAVADTVEAMSSHRPYRPALGLDAALREVESRAGSHYDATVVAACTRLFREKKFQIPT